jgi:quercetin dioxygenase-like cupin family protein
MIGKKETKIKPYINDANVRTFSKKVNSMELVWHQDKEDRNIEILEGEGWLFQRDNELPLLLKEGDRIFITANQIHRIIKGNTDLKIKING